MKIAAATLSAIPLVLAAATADARPSTPSEMRGYSNCVEQFDEASRGLVTKRDYLLHKGESGTTYYINGSRWADEGREAVRMECQTTQYGRTVLAASIEPGHFSNRTTNVRVEVASN